MKKILLFSLLFVAAGSAAIAQQKTAKQSVAGQKKTISSIKTGPSVQEKSALPKNKKHLSLQRTQLQPAIVPAELKDQRAN